MLLDNEKPKDCSGCCACCMHMGYPEYITGDPNHPDHGYWQSVPEDLKQQLIQYQASYQRPKGEMDLPCVWLDQDTKQCRHHEYRPSVCRRFQVGCRDCLGWRDVYPPESL
ncbi:MAG: YkgJ family cysteine cluster protein [Planctomycetota bacterium]